MRIVGRVDGHGVVVFIHLNAHLAQFRRSGRNTVAFLDAKRRESGQSGGGRQERRDGHGCWSGVRHVAEIHGAESLELGRPGNPHRRGAAVDPRAGALAHLRKGELALVGVAAQVREGRCAAVQGREGHVVGGRRSIALDHHATAAVPSRRHEDGDVVLPADDPAAPRHFGLGDTNVGRACALTFQAQLEATREARRRQQEGRQVLAGDVGPQACLGRGRGRPGDRNRQEAIRRLDRAADLLERLEEIPVGPVVKLGMSAEPRARGPQSGVRQEQSQRDAAHAEIELHGAAGLGSRAQRCGLAVARDRGAESPSAVEHGVDVVATWHAFQAGRLVREGGHQDVAESDRLAARQDEVERKRPPHAIDAARRHRSPNLELMSRYFPNLWRNVYQLGYGIGRGSFLEVQNLTTRPSERRSAFATSLLDRPFASIHSRSS